jgi:putative endonuclease
MFYVYILHSLKDNGFYTGYTADLKRRINEHYSGQGGRTTSIRLPLKLIYYEAYINEQDAKGRELFLKSGSGKRYLKKQLKNYLNNDVNIKNI